MTPKQGEKLTIVAVIAAVVATAVFVSRGKGGSVSEWKAGDCISWFGAPGGVGESGPVYITDVIINGPDTASPGEVFYRYSLQPGVPGDSTFPQAFADSYRLPILEGGSRGTIVRC